MCSVRINPKLCFSWSRESQGIWAKLLSVSSSALRPEELTDNNTINALLKVLFQVIHCLARCDWPCTRWEATAGMNNMTNAILRVNSTYFGFSAMKPEMPKWLILFIATAKLEICQRCVFKWWQRQFACSSGLASSQTPVTSAFLKRLLFVNRIVWFK